MHGATIIFIFVWIKAVIRCDNIYLWLKFTCDDDPHHGNDSLKKQAIKKANDLAETKISLELLPVGKADFDARKFYVDLVPEVDDVSSSAQRFEDLLSVVKKRVHKKRALARIRFLSALSCT